MEEAVQTAILGVTGYSGAELARLLMRHPRLKRKPPVFVGRLEAKDEARGGVPLDEIHPQFHTAFKARHEMHVPRMQAFSWELCENVGVEVLFLATPHELSRQTVPEARKRGIRVIDLSGAWRLEEAANRAVYGFDDEGSASALETQAEAVYGMPELHRCRDPRAPDWSPIPAATRRRSFSPSNRSSPAGPRRPRVTESFATRKVV